MFENIGSFFRRIVKPEQKELGSKDAAKERLHLVLMQDRANVSSEFLELMKQEILDVIKKYIIVDESQIDVRLTNQQNEDGTNGAPSLYANIPIVNIKNEMLVGKVKEFDSKTNSINFGEYKMVIESVSNVDGEIEGQDTQNIVLEEVVQNKEDSIDKLSEEEKQEVVEEIKEEIKEKIEEVKEALAEEQSQKDKEEANEIENTNVEVEINIEKEITENIEEPVIIFNDTEENKIEEKEELEEVKNEENSDIEEKNDFESDEDEEEDDDDVTFDDLLKAAEEEDRLLEEQSKKKNENENEIDSVKVQHNNRNQTNKNKNHKRKGKK